MASIEQGFNALSIKGIAIVVDTPESRKLLGNNLAVILVSKKEWLRIERLLQKKFGF